MSVYYHIQEHLSIQDTGAQADLRDCLRTHLQYLTPLTRHCDVRWKITVTADGETLVSDNQARDSRLEALLALVDRAGTLDFCAHYDYSTHCRAVSSFDPFALSFFFQAMEAVPAGVTYTLYNAADCDNSVGGLWGCGITENGVVRGDIPQRPLEAFPDSGVWTFPKAAVIFDTGAPVGPHFEQIADVCRQMCAFSSGDELDLEEDQVITFFLNDLKLQSAAELEKFAALAAELDALTAHQCFITDELVDHTAPDARILKLHYGSSHPVAWLTAL